MLLDAWGSDRPPGAVSGKASWVVRRLSRPSSNASPDRCPERATLDPSGHPFVATTELGSALPLG